MFNEIDDNVLDKEIKFTSRHLELVPEMASVRSNYLAFTKTYKKKTVRHQNFWGASTVIK